jgi:hypothetical protein
MVSGPERRPRRVADLLGSAACGGGGGGQKVRNQARPRQKTRLIRPGTSDTTEVPPTAARCPHSIFWSAGSGAARCAGEARTAT